MINILSPFTALCSVGFFARLSYALARSPVLPLFALYLGAGPEAIGFAVGVSTVTGIFFKLPAGALSDVIGRKRTMLIGLLFFAFMPFAYLLVKDYSLLIVIRFLHGLATAIYGPVAMAVVADIAGKNKGEMLSWFSSVTIIGNLLGAPLGGFILHRGAGAASPSIADFQYAYLASGIAGLFSLVLAVSVLRGDKPAEAGKGLKEAFLKFISGIKEVISDKRIAITSAMEGLQNMTVGALEAFLPIYAVKVVGLNEFQAGILWGVQVVTTILSKPIMGKTSDKYGRKALITAGAYHMRSFLWVDSGVQGLLSAHDNGRFLRSGRGAWSNRPALRLWLTFARKNISALPWGPSGRSLISVMLPALFSQGFSWQATVISSHSR